MLCTCGCGTRRAGQPTLCTAVSQGTRATRALARNSSLNKCANVIIETSGALLTALTESTVQMLLPEVWLAGDRLTASIPLLNPRWTWWSNPGNVAGCKARVCAWPLGPALSILFWRSSPRSQNKVRMGPHSSKGQACHLFCYILNQGSTNSSLWFSWRLFFFK